MSAGFKRMGEPDRPLRILQVLRAPVGGLFRHVVDLSHGLIDRGHEVGLVMDAADAGPRWEPVIEALSRRAVLGITRVPMSRKIGLKDVRATAHLLHRIKAGRIDIVHGHGAKGGAFARIAATVARQSGAPARFYTPHGGSLHFSPASLEGRLYHTLERILAGASEAILFESAFARDGFAGMLGLRDPAWPVIPNGLHEAEFDPVPLAADAADIVFIGEMRELKGVDLLISAIAGAKRPLTALLVGAGPDEARFKAEVVSKGLAERVRFAAPMPARAAFALGRIVVVPSRKESLPYLVLEAAAAAKPLIATNTGGIPEIFGKDRHRLVPPGDSAALGIAIGATVENPAEAVSNAVKLQAFVKDVFSAAKMIDMILAAYCSKLNHKKIEGI